MESGCRAEKQSVEKHNGFSGTEETNASDFLNECTLPSLHGSDSLFAADETTWERGFNDLACFCADSAQKHAIKNKPAPRMGRVGWG